MTNIYKNITQFIDKKRRKEHLIFLVKFRKVKRVPELMVKRVPEMIPPTEIYLPLTVNVIITLALARASYDISDSSSIIGLAKLQ
jgi:hypothetical protein